MNLTANYRNMTTADFAAKAAAAFSGVSVLPNAEVFNHAIRMSAMREDRRLGSPVITINCRENNELCTVYEVDGEPMLVDSESGETHDPRDPDYITGYKLTTFDPDDF